MRVEIRLYKRHDVDLLSLRQQGVPVFELMKIAVAAYANGKPVKFYIKPFIGYKPDTLQMVHSGVDFKDPKSDVLLSSIRENQRNNFCKAVLREALFRIPIGVFFPSVDGQQADADMAAAIDAASMPNLYICEAQPLTEQEILDSILPEMDGKPIKQKKKARFKINKYVAGAVNDLVTTDVPDPVKEAVKEATAEEAPKQQEPKKPKKKAAPKKAAPEKDPLVETTAPDATEVMEQDEEDELFGMIKDLF